MGQKLKMKSIKRVFKKYDTDLSKLPDTTGFSCPNLNCTPKKFSMKHFRKFPDLPGYFKWVGEIFKRHLSPAVLLVKAKKCPDAPYQAYTNDQCQIKRYR